MNEPIDRRRFLRRAVAAASAGGILSAQGAELCASEVREGLNISRLDELKDQLAARHTTDLLIMRHHRIVYEWYAPGWGPARPHYTASLAKQVVGGMSLLVALNDGRLKLDDPVCKFIPAWRGDPQRSKITIKELATHTSGIEDAEEDEKFHSQLTGWKGAFWRGEPDPFTVAIHQAPIVFPPGSRFAYSNPGYAALGYAVTASLKGAPQTDILSLLRDRIMRPLGVPDEDWSLNHYTYEKLARTGHHPYEPYEVDGLKLYATWGGANYTARATAAVGQLMMQRGEWNGRQLVKREWAKTAVQYAGMPLPDRKEEGPYPGFGLGWYTNFDGVWSLVPRDAFAGEGAGQQFLLVIPSLNLIAVRYGELLSRQAVLVRTDKVYLNVMVDDMINPLMRAVRPVSSASPKKL